MAFFGLFKKKEQPEELPDISREELGLPPEQSSAEGPDIHAPPGMGIENYQQPQQPQENKDIQILTAKVDALRAVLDSINQRLENLERIARGEREY